MTADPLITAARFLAAQMPWLRHARTEQGGPVAADVFREIGDCAARMRGLVEGPREQRFLGPCGAELCTSEYEGWICKLAHGHQTRHTAGDGGLRNGATWISYAEPAGPRACEGDVYGVAGAQTGRCRTCKTEYPQDQRLIWLIDQVSGSDLAWTAKGIADALSINVNTIRTWAHERRSDTGVLLRAAKLGTFWRDREGRLVPWVEPALGEDVKARGDRLHYVADVTALAREAAERRAQREARTRIIETLRKAAEMGA